MKHFSLLCVFLFFLSAEAGEEQSFEKSSKVKNKPKGFKIPSVEEQISRQKELEILLAKQPVSRQKELEILLAKQPVSRQKELEILLAKQPVSRQKELEILLAKQPVSRQKELEILLAKQPVSRQKELEILLAKQPVSRQKELEILLAKQPVSRQKELEILLAKQPVSRQKELENPSIDQPVSQQKKLEIPSVKKPSSAQTNKLSQKKECSAGGQELIYSHTFSSRALNISKGIEGWFQKSLPYVKKKPAKKCPVQCRQNNTYQVFSKVYPKTVKKGSCKGKSSKESYSFKKDFLYLKDSIEKTQHNMLEWMLGTFVYPFFSIFAMEPSLEAIKSNIADACPSCSFYLDYSYKYIEGKGLNLNIKARCGDMRRLVSKFKFEFTLVNNWQCAKGIKGKG